MSSSGPFYDAADHRPDEVAAMWDALTSIDALSEMPRHIVRADVRSATRDWPRPRARAFARAVQLLIRARRTRGVIQAFPRGGAPRGAAGASAPEFAFRGA